MSSLVQRGFKIGGQKSLRILFFFWGGGGAGEMPEAEKFQYTWINFEVTPSAYVKAGSIS